MGNQCAVPVVISKRFKHITCSKVFVAPLDSPLTPWLVGLHRRVVFALNAGSRFSASSLCSVVGVMKALPQKVSMALDSRVKTAKPVKLIPIGVEPLVTG